ncbi:BgTH12-07716 [Blumeria graminis f. sp. triticale]|uniref:Bgt-2199 n=3 Tax=Blumeria graminis TaxID=34373 RepID=A0A061HCN5_BLUGR|nr:hypothetical protein BGT96224_2199 [Blumeria graminis f. sp. tritici 96224]CAD6506489.1 BgTH12-07716 [Blumeria graminis f. sp. triticale]
MTLKVEFMNNVPQEYTTPPWPALYWPLYGRPDVANYLYYTLDIWRFTLFWTLIFYAGTHGMVALVALVMQVGKGHLAWQYAWIIPVSHTFVAMFEAVMAGSIVGLTLGAVYESGYFRMSTWIPFTWGLINVLFLVISSFSFSGGF